MTNEQERLRIGGLVRKYNNTLARLRELKPTAIPYDRVKRRADVLELRITLLIYNSTIR